MKILPLIENRVVFDSVFRITSVLLSHFAYTSCKRVESISTILEALYYNCNLKIIFKNYRNFFSYNIKCKI